MYITRDSFSCELSADDWSFQSGALRIDSQRHKQDKCERVTLAKLIYERDFDRAIERANNYRDEVRELSPYPNGTSCIMPLHLCLSMRPLPPLSLIKSLIELYPEAVKQKEDVWGYLPLHLACRFDISNKKRYRDTNEATQCTRSDQDHVRIVDALLKIYPEGASEKEKFRGMLPVHLAVEANASVKVVSMLINAFPEGVVMEDNFGEIPMDFIRRSVTMTPKRAEIEHCLKRKMIDLTKRRKNSKNGDDISCVVKDMEVPVNFLWRKMEKELVVEGKRIRSQYSGLNISLTAMKQARSAMRNKTKLLQCTNTVQKGMKRPASENDLSEITSITDESDGSVPRAIFIRCRERGIGNSQNVSNDFKINPRLGKLSRRILIGKKMRPLEGSCTAHSRQLVRCTSESDLSSMYYSQVK